MCPECEREFAVPGQGHFCLPGTTVDGAIPPRFRATFAAIVAAVEEVGPVHLDAVSVGVFLKADRKLAEVRPMARALSLNLFLPREVDSPRIARTMRTSQERVLHMVRLTDPAQVDDEVRAWIAEAYLAAT